MQKNGAWSLEEAKVQHKHSPRLAEALKTVFPLVDLVNDYGCGKGTYLNHLSKSNYRCKGFDGTYNIFEIADFHDISYLDLTKPFHQEKGNTLCLEVAEHIPKHAEKIFIKNLIDNTLNMLVISWAVKGQGGHGHVNEQDAEYVIKKFKEFKLNEKKTNYLRQEGGADLWWFAKSIYVFER